jgi:hypothetical protein
MHTGISETRIAHSSGHGDDAAKWDVDPERDASELMLDIKEVTGESVGRGSICILPLKARRRVNV